MKKDNNKIFFALGLFFLILAMLSITIVPPIFKKTFNISFADYTIVQLEFFTLFMCSIFYFLSHKYYEQQCASIFIALFYYLTFVKFYPLIF